MPGARLGDHTGPMANHIDGRVIVITGAASGFGRLVAEKTAALGAAVVASDVNTADLDEVVSSINAQGHRAVAIEADVADAASMHALADEAVTTFGAVDVLVNNAGVMPLAFFADHAAAAEAWDRCIDINLKGVVHGISAVHDHMIGQGRGHIINVSSTYGNAPVPGGAVYGATKAAVRFLSEALRQESQGKIKVTTVRPSGVPGTGLTDGIVNRAGLTGILSDQDRHREMMARYVAGDLPSETTDPDSVGYWVISPDELADQIVHVIDQPWGVVISDITVRAAGETFRL